MADVFISYARADRDRIEKLAAALEGEGYTVWWDRHIAGGEEFSKDIERELAAARAVIVGWSKDANDSRWVKDEAGMAADEGKLIAIMLDGSSPPIGFKQFHAIDYGAATPAAFADLKRSVDLKLGRDIDAAPAAVEASLNPSDRVRTLLISTGLALSVLAGGYLVLKSITQKSPTAEDEIVAQEQGVPALAGQAAQAYESIAVLAFADLSPDRDQEYFSDGIAEELLNVLARETELRVAARTSSFAFKDKTESIAAIGEALNVDAILEGSVRKAGDKVRITAQLIDARSGFHLWSDTYDRELTDIFTVQDEIASDIARSLPMTGAAREIAAVAPAESDAYDLYLQGRHLLVRRTGSSIRAAISLFEQAVAADPGYAPAWADLAFSTMLLREGPNSYGNLSEAEIMAVAEPAVEKALELNPKLAEAHTAQGMLLANKGEFSRAIDAYQRAIDLNPSTPNARHLLYLVLQFEGRFRESFEVIENAAALDPLSAIILENLVWSYLLQERNDDAFAAARRLDELHPDWPLTKVALANAYNGNGQFAEAAKLMLEQADRDATNIRSGTAFQLIHLRLFDHPLLQKAPFDPASFLDVVEGRNDEARKIVLDRRALEPDNPFLVWRIGWTLWAIGDDDAAHEIFEDFSRREDVIARNMIVSPSSCYPGLYVAGLRQWTGDPAAAGSIIEKCRKTLENMEAQGYILPYYERDMGIELMMLEGRHEEALSELRKLADSGKFISWWIEFEPIYEPVRDDPRFKAIVADLIALAESEQARFNALQDRE